MKLNRAVPFQKYQKTVTPLCDHWAPLKGAAFYHQCSHLITILWLLLVDWKLETNLLNWIILSPSEWDHSSLWLQFTAVYCSGGHCTNVISITTSPIKNTKMSKCMCLVLVDWVYLPARRVLNSGKGNATCLKGGNMCVVVCVWLQKKALWLTEPLALLNNFPKLFLMCGQHSWRWAQVVSD